MTGIGENWYIKLDSDVNNEKGYVLSSQPANYFKILENNSFAFDINKLYCFNIVDPSITPPLFFSKESTRAAALAVLDADELSGNRYNSMKNSGQNIFEPEITLTKTKLIFPSLGDTNLGKWYIYHEDLTKLNFTGVSNTFTDTSIGKNYPSGLTVASYSNGSSFYVKLDDNQKYIISATKTKKLASNETPNS